MPPLQAYALDIAGSMLGIAGFTVLSAAGHGADRLVPSCSAVLLLLGGPRGGHPAGIARHRRDARGDPRRRSSSRLEAGRRSGRRTTGSTRTTAGGDRRRSTSTASPTRRCSRSTRPKEPFYDQVYNWFPDRTFDERPHRRRGLGHGRRDRAGDTAPSHVDAVEIDPAIQKLGRRAPSRTTRTRTRASRAINERRPGVPAPAPTRSTTWSSSRCRTR